MSIALTARNGSQCAFRGRSRTDVPGLPAAVTLFLPPVFVVPLIGLLDLLRGLSPGSGG